MLKFIVAAVSFALAISVAQAAGPSAPGSARQIPPNMLTKPAAQSSGNASPLALSCQYTVGYWNQYLQNVRIDNKGPGAAPSGMKLRWTVGSKTADFVLKQPLTAGGTVWVGSVTPETKYGKVVAYPCTVFIVVNY